MSPIAPAPRPRPREDGSPPVTLDLRQGLRGLRGAPRTALAALACIALGIGSAVFMVTLIDAVLLRRAPFPQAERLVRVWNAPEAGEQREDLSFLDFRDVLQAAGSFESFQLASRTRVAMSTEEGTERIRGEAVTPGYFDLIGLRPHLGRLFGEHEYAPASDRVILLGHDLWRRRFGGRRDIVGQTVTLRGNSEPAHLARPYVVVGVMPPGFVGTVDPDTSEFWIPSAHYVPARLMEERTSRAGWTIGRLRRGVSLRAAQDEMQQIGRALAARHPVAYRDLRLLVEPFGQSWRSKYQRGLYALLAAAFLLLAIACANIANLLLAGLARRRQELAVRAVLGASWWRIARQLLVESLVLATLGGAAGALLAFLGLRLFAAGRVIQVPPYVDLAPDLRVLGATVALVLATGVTFGVLPAWLGARASASAALRENGRAPGQQGRGQRRLGRTLVVLEVAFTFVLLVASGLLVRSYGNLVRSDPGYRTGALLRMAVSLDRAEYPDARAQTAFARRAKERIASQPGVLRVAFLAGVLPPWFDERMDLAVDGRPVEALRGVGSHAADEDFLPTLDIALLAGRNFDPRVDRASAPPVVIISRSLADRLRDIGGRADPIGSTVQYVADRESGRLSAPLTIVGVAEDVQYHGPLLPRPADLDLYVPLEQNPYPTLSIAVHTAPGIDPASLIGPLQRELGRLAPTSPQHWISTMEEELAAQYGDARFHAWLTGIYAASAILLAVLGLYSVLAHSVSRRRGEIGVRLALGARGGDIVRLVAGEGLRTVLLGLGLGAGLAAAGVRVVASRLHGVPPHDLATFAAVAAALLGFGALAALIPARRAARADPLEALRASRG